LQLSSSLRSPAHHKSALDLSPIVYTHPSSTIGSASPPDDSLILGSYRITTGSCLPPRPPTKQSRALCLLDHPTRRAESTRTPSTIDFTASGPFPRNSGSTKQSKCKRYTYFTTPNDNVDHLHFTLSVDEQISPSIHLSAHLFSSMPHD